MRCKYFYGEECRFRNCLPKKDWYCTFAIKVQKHIHKTIMYWPCYLCIYNRGCRKCYRNDCCEK